MALASGDELGHGSPRPFLPPHTVHIGGEGTRNDFSTAVTDRLQLDAARPLHLHYAFGGTSALGAYERPSASAYARMAAEWQGQLDRGQVVVVDGATRAGHVLLLERALRELKSADREARHLASFGITSAAALFEAGMPRSGSGERAAASSGLFNHAHSFTAVVDNPEADADWGFETLFFFDSMASTCRRYRTLAPTQPIRVTASFVNGGEVTAKELAFSALLLGHLASKFQAETEIVVWAGTGRLAASAAGAAREGAELRVGFRCAQGAELSVALKVGDGVVRARVEPMNESPEPIVGSRTAWSVSCIRPLSSVEEQVLLRGGGTGVKVTVVED